VAANEALEIPEKSVRERLWDCVDGPECCPKRWLLVALGASVMIVRISKAQPFQSLPTGFSPTPRFFRLSCHDNYLATFAAFSLKRDQKAPIFLTESLDIQNIENTPENEIRKNQKKTQNPGMGWPDHQSSSTLPEHHPV
jgi:hypothetical protein